MGMDQYINLNDKCFINSLAYNVHKEKRIKYRQKERKCVPRNCTQYCSMEILDPTVTDNLLCYYQIQSFCTEPSETGFGRDLGYWYTERIDPRKLNIPRNVKEYCLCAAEYNILYITGPFSCVCYSKDWNYCLNSNDTQGECNFMRKHCTHRNSLFKTRFTTICKIERKPSTYKEDTYFSESISSNDSTIIYNISNPEHVFTLKQIMDRDKNKFISDSTLFDNTDQLKLTHTSSNSDMLMPNMFYLFIFVFYLFTYLEYFRKTHFNFKRKKHNGFNQN